jgi:hypothetical protein
MLPASVTSATLNVLKFHTGVIIFLPKFKMSHRRIPLACLLLMSPGVKFYNMVCPQGWSLPLGGMLTASFPRRGEQSLLFRRMEGPTENFNPGDNFTPRGQIHPWGVSKFDPRGEVENGPLVSLLCNWTNVQNQSGRMSWICIDTRESLNGLFLNLMFCSTRFTEKAVENLENSCTKAPDECPVQGWNMCKKM